MTAINELWKRTMLLGIQMRAWNHLELGLKHLNHIHDDICKDQLNALSMEITQRCVWCELLPSTPISRPSSIFSTSIPNAIKSPYIPQKRTTQKWCLHSNTFRVGFICSTTALNFSTCLPPNSYIDWFISINWLIMIIAAIECAVDYC